MNHQTLQAVGFTLGVFLIVCGVLFLIGCAICTQKPWDKNRRRIGMRLFIATMIATNCGFILLLLTKGILQR